MKRKEKGEEGESQRPMTIVLRGGRESERTTRFLLFVAEGRKRELRIRDDEGIKGRREESSREEEGGGGGRRRSEGEVMRQLASERKWRKEYEELCPFSRPSLRRVKSGEILLFAVLWFLSERKCKEDEEREEGEKDKKTWTRRRGEDGEEQRRKKITKGRKRRLRTVSLFLSLSSFFF